MTESPRFVRFLVGLQLRPATATVVAFATILFLGFVAREVGSDPVLVAFFIFATSLATTMAEIGARTGSMWGRLVVVGFAAGATVPLAYAAFDMQSKELIPFVAATVAAPSLVVAVASRAQVLRHRLAVALVAAYAAAAPSLIEATKPPSTVRILLLVLWVVAIQLAFHAAATSGIRTTRLSVTAAVLGATSAALAFAAGQRLSPIAWTIGLAGGWFLGSLCLPAARLGRSFTAVPLDHPIHEDFGGPPPS